MYRLKQNLGRDDATLLNKKFGAAIALDKLAAGNIIDLPEEAERYLSKRFPALLESVGTVRAVAPRAAVTAPKRDEPKPKDD